MSLYSDLKDVSSELDSEGSGTNNPEVIESPQCMVKCCMVCQFDFLISKIFQMFPGRKLIEGLDKFQKGCCGG